MRRLSLLCLLLIAVSGSSRAHGPAPSALNIFFEVDGPLRLVHTNIGLGVPSDDGGFSYLCPTFWGEEDFFPKPLIDGDGMITVPTNGSLFRYNGCEFTEVPFEGWEGQLAGQDGSYVLERMPSGSRLWRVNDSPEVHWQSDDVSIDSIKQGRAEIVAGTARNELSIFRIDSEGFVERLNLRSPPLGDYVSIRLTSPVWFTLSSQSGITLFEVVGDEAVSRAEVARILHGPVHWNDGIAWIEENRLMLRRADRTTVVDTVDWKCLKEDNSRIYACKNRGIVEINPEGETYQTEVLFELSDFTGVDPDCPAEGSGQRAVCLRQWYHYGGEAGLVTDQSPTDNSATEKDGCQVNLSTHGWFLTLFILLLMRPRRFEG